MVCFNSYNPYCSLLIFIIFWFFYPLLFLLQDIQQAHAGQIVAVFGVDCASGTKADTHRPFVLIALSLIGPNEIQFFHQISYYFIPQYFVNLILYALFLGDTFTDGSVKYTMTSMSVPEPVMSLAISSVSKDSGGNVSYIDFILISVLVRWLCA